LRIPRDNVREFLSRISPYVLSEGARNFHRISKELSIPYGTLRFRMLRLKDQGISIVPVIDMKKIGLERFDVSFEISPETKSFNHKSFFLALHNSAGLIHYSRYLFSQSVNCEFVLPEEKKGELRKILRSLERSKLITRPVTRKISWKEIISMKTEFFDYKRGEWNIDYSKLSPGGAPRPRESAQERFEYYDRTDLMIIKSIQSEPWIKSIEMAKSMGLSDSDIAYHLNNHVIGKGQIPGFRFKWVGTKDELSKHLIVPVNFLFKSLDERSQRRIIPIVTAPPFTWSHWLCEDGTYVAELLVHASQMSETMRFLSSHLESGNFKPDAILFPDLSWTQDFVIPHSLHTKEEGWRFEAETAVKEITQAAAGHHAAKKDATHLNS
jgi:hypothetical protein